MPLLQLLHNYVFLECMETQMGKGEPAETCICIDTM